MSRWGDAHCLVSAAARPPPPAAAPPPPPARRRRRPPLPARRRPSPPLTRPRRARRASTGSRSSIPRARRSGCASTSCAPHSVNDLPEVKGDPRTPDKLVDGVNDTYDDAHMWLAPFARGSNLLSISLTSVQRGGQRIGALRLWNYAKTAARGVRHFAVYIDGALLYQGSLRPAPPRRRGCAPTVLRRQFRADGPVHRQPGADRAGARQRLHEGGARGGDRPRRQRHADWRVAHRGRQLPADDGGGGIGRQTAAGGGQPRSSMTLACGASLVLVFQPTL